MVEGEAQTRLTHKGVTVSVPVERKALTFKDVLLAAMDARVIAAHPDDDLSAMIRDVRVDRPTYVAYKDATFRKTGTVRLVGETVNLARDVFVNTKNNVLRRVNPHRHA